jgi:hypothetical protein
MLCGKQLKNLMPAQNALHGNNASQKFIYKDGCLLRLCTDEFVGKFSQLLTFNFILENICWNETGQSLIS